MTAGTRAKWGGMPWDSWGHNYRASPRGRASNCYPETPQHWRKLKASYAAARPGCHLCPCHLSHYRTQLP